MGRQPARRVDARADRLGGWLLERQGGMPKFATANAGMFPAATDVTAPRPWLGYVAWRCGGFSHIRGE